MVVRGAKRCLQKLNLIFQIFRTLLHFCELSLSLLEAVLEGKDTAGVFADIRPGDAHIITYTFILFALKIQAFCRLRDKSFFVDIYKKIWETDAVIES